MLGDQQPRGENKNQFPVRVFANYNGKHLNMKRHILSLIYSVILLESRAVSQGRLAIQTCDNGTYVLSDKRKERGGQAGGS